MLFVYYVENGTMLTFDISITLENVSNLQEEIAKELQIPIERQVLLINGGESLESNMRICNYPAGTDTNPIFLFAKRDKDFYSPVFVPPAPDNDFSHLIDEHLKMTANYVTVSKRAILARRLDETARENMRLCEECVHEQHLQQQGWAAVVANLDDTVASFKRVAHEAEEVIVEYLSKRDHYLEIISHFYDDLKILERIPVLPSLLKPKRQLDSYKEELLMAAQDLDVAAIPGKPEEAVEEPEEMTLLAWLTNENKSSSMDDVYLFCSQGLAGCNENFLECLRNKVKNILHQVGELNMREVKGLSERLSSLERVMRDYRKIVQEQSDLAQSFQMNSTRASSIRDPSILPDLCESHCKQLKVMYENHKRCISMKGRIFNAKRELCVSLVSRLEWVTSTENQMAELNSTLVCYKVKLSHINAHFQFLQQIHEAPVMYLSAVIEVFRRRIFSQSSLLWASDLACQLLTQHNNEVALRKEFCANFEEHFIANLFPGIEDLPSAYGTQPPQIFDSNLPEIKREDIDRLVKLLPEFAEHLRIPDTTAITNFFAARAVINISSDRVYDDNKPVEEKLEEVAREAGLENVLDGNLLKGPEAEPCNLAAGTSHGLPHLKDLDKGCESETDTEEFEKVGQSPMDLHFDKEIPSAKPGKQDASTLTESPRDAQVESPNSPSLGHQPTNEFASDEYYIDESLPSSLSIEQAGQENTDLDKQLDTANSVVALLQGNLQMSHEEHEKLKTTTTQLVNLTQQALHDLRNEVTVLKKFFAEETSATVEEQKNICLKLENIISEKSDEYQKMLSKLQKQRETDMDDYKTCIEKLDKQAENLSEEKKLLEDKLMERDNEKKELAAEIERHKEKNEHKIKELLEEIEVLQKDRAKSIKEATDRLGREHKTELENIVSRFRFMTVERSRSETNLERAEKSEILSNYESILQQMHDNYEVDKNEAVNKEIGKAKQILEEQTRELNAKFEQEKDMLVQEVARRISEEKDKQIDVLREREANLTLECSKYKFTIQQLAEQEAENDRSMEIVAKDVLEKLTYLENHKSDLEEQVEQLTKNRMELLTQLKTFQGAIGEVDVPVTCCSKSKKEGETRVLKLQSFKSGDFVFVFWDPEHHNFRILQSDGHLYFLHSESLEDLGLKIENGQPNKHFVNGEVVNKEYCHARRSGNRYKVPQGTKFFRLRVKPISHHSHTLQDTTHMSQSQTVVPTGSEFSTSEAGPSHSLPSSPTKTCLTVVEEGAEEIAQAMVKMYLESKTSPEVMLGSPPKQSPIGLDSSSDRVACSVSDQSHGAANLFIMEDLESSVAVEDDRKDSLLMDLSYGEKNASFDSVPIIPPEEKDIIDPGALIGDTTVQQTDPLVLESAPSPRETGDDVKVEKTEEVSEGLLIDLEGAVYGDPEASDETSVGHTDGQGDTTPADSVFGGNVTDDSSSSSQQNQRGSDR